MDGFKFMCRTATAQYRRKWQPQWKAEVVRTPYWGGHKQKNVKLQFVSDYWFDVYFKRSEKAKRLFWRLHPNERR